MRRRDALAALRTLADAVREMGATSMYLYGSTVEDKAAPSSDLDVYVDYDPAGRFNAFDLVGIKQFLEAKLGSKVDITTRDGLHPCLRDRIEMSAVRIL